MRRISLRSAILLLFAASAGLLLSAARPSRSSTPPEDTPSSKQPVLVELFTSEGCSSCPPADLFLKQISQQQPFANIQILALEEHVDYWNSPAWIDPFSSNDFSQRQQQYSESLRSGEVYTPQMVVDGESQLVGSRTNEAADAIQHAAAHPIARLVLSPAASSKNDKRAFEFHLDPASALPASSPLDLWIAVTESGLHSSVTGGENSGHELQHAPVVRFLHKQQTVSLPFANPITFTVNLHKNWNPSNLNAVAFLAVPKTHQVLAAGSSPL